MSIKGNFVKDDSDENLAFDKLIEELELVRLELNAAVHNSNNDLLNEEVIRISQKLDYLIVQYLNIAHKKKAGDK